jgi:putative ABC transport system permease protein
MNWTYDVWTALKSLRASRGTTLAAVVTLALGTGANTAVLAVAYGVLLRPLPFHQPDRLVRVDIGIRLQDVPEWQQRSRAFTSMAAYTVDQVTVRGGGEAQSVRAALVAGPLFEVLGTGPEFGRPPDDKTDAAVLSDRYVRRFGSASADLVGRSLVVGGRSYQVAAVVPPALAFPDEDVLLWLPARSVEGVALFGRGDTRAYSLVARLRTGITLPAARQDAERVLAEVDPVHARGLTGLVEPLSTAMVGDAQPVLVLFVAAAALLLLVACANVATLLLGRSMARTRELAVRLAIGASPARLLRTALAESFVIAIAGSALGALTAKAGVAAFVSVAGTNLPRTAAIAIDLPVLAAVAGIALVVTVLCGTAPALAAARTHFAPAFRQASDVGSRGRRLQAILVGAQVTAAVVLLVGAGLFGRTVAGLLGRGAGIQSDRALAVSMMLTESARVDASSRQVLVDDVLRRVRALPGVVAAGFGAGLPPRHALTMSIRMVNDTGRDDTYLVNLIPVTPGYFQALGIRLLRGRSFEEADDQGSDPVAVISERAARELTFAGDPLGSVLPFALPTSTGRRVKARVIGIASDVRYSGLDASAAGNVYVRWRQLPVGTPYLAVRVAGDPTAMIPVVTRAVHQVDPTVPLLDARTLDAEMNLAIAGRELRL